MHSPLTALVGQSIFSISYFMVVDVHTEADGKIIVFLTVPRHVPCRTRWFKNNVDPTVHSTIDDYEMDELEEKKFENIRAVKPDELPYFYTDHLVSYVTNAYHSDFANFR